MPRSAATRARLTALRIATVVWLVLLGIYSLTLTLTAWDAESSCFIASSGGAHVTVSWVPPGYACVSTGPGDDVEVYWGPGIGTALLQVFLVAVPLTGWWCARNTGLPASQRRELREAWQAGAFGLCGVGFIDLVLGLGLIALVMALVSLPLFLLARSVRGASATPADVGDHTAAGSD